MVYNPAGENNNNEVVGKDNAGLRTLFDICDLMREIKNMSVRVHLPEYRTIMSSGQIQHAKAKLVKQLFIRSAPLIKKDKIPTLMQQFNNIKLSWLSKTVGRQIDATSYAAIPKGYYEAYNPRLEDQLDTFEIAIALALQESGKYFAVEKEDLEGL